MSKIKEGDTVNIQYVAKLKDGTVFDSSPEGEYFEFTIGDAGNLPELEETILEMELGETKTLILPPEKAYGKYDEGLVIQFPKESLPENFEIEEGQYILYETDENELKRVKVKDKDEFYLYLDYNHPMAGKTLQYEIKLIEIL